MMLLSTLFSAPSPSTISIIISSCDDIDDDDDDGDDVGCCSSHHLQAQRLNNTAATCIENGHTYYEKAITILTKALRICETEQDQKEHEHAHEHAYDVCACHYCSIDGCIDINDDATVITEDNNDDTIIYQNPIFVYEGHHMASSLMHIISFNLAIAHHFTAQTTMATTITHENENENETSNENDKESFINKALQFYELAYECNLSNTSCSVRFDTIICNNLSHIYRYQEQTEEQEQQEKRQEQNEEQEQPQPQPQRITVVAADDKSIELDELLELEYYTQEEEQEEYEHNISLISLLTSAVSTTASSTTSTRTTTSPAPSSTKTSIPTTRTIRTDKNEGFRQNYVMPSADCGGCNKSSSLLLIKQQQQGGEDFCVITEHHDSQRSLYATCA